MIVIQKPQRPAQLVRSLLFGLCTVSLVALTAVAPVATAETIDEPSTVQPVSTKASDMPPAVPDDQVPTSAVGNTESPEITQTSPEKQEVAPRSIAPAEPTSDEQFQVTSKQHADILVTHQLESSAQSGQATVSDNSFAGDATSGQATANGTIVNVIHSSTGLSDNTPITFVQDITGDVQGDITIDPSNLTVSSAGTHTLNLANQSLASSGTITIDNTVKIQALSGDAKVSGNGSAGSALSGDATALANIINIVSSSVGSGRSFVGVVNIHGSLKGDILVPRSLVDSLLASNLQNGAPQTATAPSNGTTTNNVSIANTVDLKAVSGTATVRDNQQSGNASSGDATTNLTVFNLTGQQVVAKNSLLVFVNVLGEWVGMIVPAPAGSTAAALGGGVTSSTASLPQGNATQNINITNSVEVEARSGDAIVQNNNQAGDARTGTATAGANIMNLVHSSYNLDDWFGALFINVLGSWLGNFDIAPEAVPVNTDALPANPLPKDAIKAVRVFQLAAPTPVSATEPTYTATTAADTPVEQPEGTIAEANSVLGKSTAAPDLPAQSQQSSTSLPTAYGLALAAAIATAALWLYWRHKRLHA